MLLTSPQVIKQKTITHYPRPQKTDVQSQACLKELLLLLTYAILHGDNGILLQGITSIAQRPLRQTVPLVM